MFTTSILRAKNKIKFKKLIMYFHGLTIIFQIVKKSKVQFKYLQVHWKKNYINLTLKTNANNS